MQWQGWLFSSDLPDPDPDRTARVSGDPFHAPDGGGQRDEAPQGPGKFTPVNYLFPVPNWHFLAVPCSVYRFLFVKYHYDYLLQKERSLKWGWRNKGKRNLCWIDKDGAEGREGNLKTIICAYHQWQLFIIFDFQIVLQIGEENMGMVRVQAANKKHALCPLKYLKEV